MEVLDEYEIKNFTCRGLYINPFYTGILTNYEKIIVCHVTLNEKWKILLRTITNTDYYDLTIRLLRDGRNYYIEIITYSPFMNSYYSAKAKVNKNFNHRKKKNKLRILSPYDTNYFVFRKAFKYEDDLHSKGYKIIFRERTDDKCVTKRVRNL